MSLPEKGTFKVETVGPKKEGTSKKGNPYKIFDLQFEGDVQWYNTYWTSEKDPVAGQELSGTKSYDENYGGSYKFEIERAGGKNNWNPASAQSTVMLAAVTLVNGFLSVGENYDLWKNNKPEVKELFSKYIATVESASKQLKEKIVAMGSLAPEQKVAEKSSSDSSDPGPGVPPEIEGFADEDEEPVEI